VIKAGEVLAVSYVLAQDQAVRMAVCLASMVDAQSAMGMVFVMVALESVNAYLPGLVPVVSSMVAGRQAAVSTAAVCLQGRVQDSMRVHAKAVGVG